MTAWDRLVRLIGTGDGDSGGGLPLPDAFSAIVTELMDHGAMSFESLAGLMKSVMSFKEKRVLSIWITWEEFTRDITDQLRDMNLVTESGGKYSLMPGFVSGQRYVVIPEADIGITVWDSRTRAERDANTMMRQEIRKMMSDRRFARADSTAHLHLRDAESLLTEALTGKKEKRVLHVALPPEQRPPLPTAEELAHQKYGWGGGSVARSTPMRTRFGEDGLRPCKWCKIRKPPSAFEVYWEGNHNNAYYLSVSCDECRANGRRRR